MYSIDKDKDDRGYAVFGKVFGSRSKKLVDEIASIKTIRAAIQKTMF